MAETATPLASPARPLRSWPAITLFAGWWVLLAVLFAAQLRMSRALRGVETPWIDALLFGAIDSFSWAAVAILALWLVGRLYSGTIGWIRSITVYAAVAVVIIPARLWLMGLLANLLRDTGPTTYTTIQRIVIATPTNLLVYVLLIGVGYTFHFVRSYRRRELEAAQLEASLAGAELEVMKMQLQPAFLARGLESIAALMHRDVGAADRGLAILGDVLRLTLQRAQRQTVSLHEELELLELFLGLQKEELGDRLRVEWVCEPDVLDAEIPSLLLQPIAEQLIRGDLDCEGDPLRLRILAQRQSGRVEIRVQSRGAGPAAAQSEHSRYGLTTVGTRLQQLYGTGEFLYLVERRENGTRVTIQVPFRQAEPTFAGALATSAGAPQVQGI